MNSGIKKTLSKTDLIIAITTFVITLILYRSLVALNVEDDNKTTLFVAFSFIIAIASGYFYAKNFVRPALLITSAILAATLINIVFEIIFIDRTSHNLLPFELIYIFIIAYFPAQAGAFIGFAIAKLFSKSTDNKV